MKKESYLYIFIKHGSLVHSFKLMFVLKLSLLVIYILLISVSTTRGSAFSSRFGHNSSWRSGLVKEMSDSRSVIQLSTKHTFDVWNLNA